VTYTCNPDFNVTQIGFITRWTPVKNLTSSGEVLYTNLDQKFSGTSTFTPGAPQPTQIWAVHDQSTLALNLRVRRNF
jgi:Porin subfamily